MWQDMVALSVVVSEPCFLLGQDSVPVMTVCALPSMPVFCALDT